MNIEPQHPIVLFDGVCNYCNSMVNLAIRHDKKSVLSFAAMQSNIGLQLREKYAIPAEIDSVVFIENDTAYTYAEATLRICKYLSGWPYIFYAFIIVPSFIANPLYKFIAKHRYTWFGKRDSCMIPSDNVKSRFLS